MVKKKNRKKNMNFFLNMLIAVLLITVLVFSYLIFESEFNTLFQEKKQTDVRNTAIPTEIPLQLNGPRGALTPPAFGATQEEQKAFYNEVFSNAKEAPYLQFTNCRANPTIYKVKNNSTVIFKNADSKGRTVTIDKREYFIGAKSQKKITVNFEAIPAFYGIGCDSLQNQSAGLLVIVAHD